MQIIISIHEPLFLSGILIYVQVYLKNGEAYIRSGVFEETNKFWTTYTCISKIQITI